MYKKLLLIPVFFCSSATADVRSDLDENAIQATDEARRGQLTLIVDTGKESITTHVQRPSREEAELLALKFMSFWEETFTVDSDVDSFMHKLLKYAIEDGEISPEVFPMFFGWYVVNMGPEVSEVSNTIFYIRVTTPDKYEMGFEE
jgi:hypothetical protein